MHHKKIPEMVNIIVHIILIAISKIVFWSGSALHDTNPIAANAMMLPSIIVLAYSGYTIFIKPNFFRWIRVVVVTGLLILFVVILAMHNLT